MKIEDRIGRQIEEVRCSVRNGKAKKEEDKRKKQTWKRVEDRKKNREKKRIWLEGK